MASRKEAAEAIISELKLIVSDADFDRMSLGTIDKIERQLRSLRAINGQSSSLDLALHYVERMKKPRADRYELGNLLKDAIWGL